jgi:hypothetical protein
MRSSSTSTTTTSFPRSARQVPVTSPTYPAPIMHIRVITQRHLLHAEFCDHASLTSAGNRPHETNDLETRYVIRGQVFGQTNVMGRLSRV